MAGATDILPWAREGRAGDVHLPAMIDLSRVPELDGYTVKDGRIRLGANIVYQQFLTDEKLRALLPCMPYCAVWFADDQIRQQATLAGNLVNASPAADGTPPMLALNGEMEIARLQGGDVAHPDRCRQRLHQRAGCRPTCNRTRSSPPLPAMRWRAMADRSRRSASAVRW